MLSAELLDAERVSDELTAEFLETAGVLPLRAAADEAARVATWLDAPDERVLDDLRILLQCEIQLVRADEHEVRAAIRRAYGDAVMTAETLISGLTPGTPGDVPDGTRIDDLRSQANEAPVVRLVNLLLLEALEARASDVHLEVYSEELSVRYRIDGVLQRAPSPPAAMAPALISRLKIMAQLDIAERRVPQDGRIRLRLDRNDIDVRVSTVPTVHGESVVLRLLDRQRGTIALDRIGMAPDTLAQFRSCIAQQHGLVLVTGPTGSGKTTTLYAALEELRTGREKILTVEDPVEYELPGVCQVPVNAKFGVTFASALRSLLRQDPDIILIGEIRDAETAEIATRAALTGHLVLATMHTNDAVSAVTRLSDLGVPDYLIASTVRGLLAQRLVRRPCADCDGRHVHDGDLAERDRPVGDSCATCADTGYRGRTGIYELLPMTDEICSALLSHSAPDDVWRIASSAGMRTLREDGARAVAARHTTPDEVLRVAG